MHKKKHLHYAIITVAGFALLFMTVGFTAYAQLTSNNKASANSVYYRDLGFDAASYLESDSSVSPSSKTIDKQSLSISLHLNPGESYASVLNLVNNGSDNELLQKIIMEGLGPELRDQVDFEVSLNGEDYIGTTENINLAVLRGELNRQQMFVSVTSRASAPFDLNLSVALDFSN